MLFQQLLVCCQLPPLFFLARALTVHLSTRTSSTKLTAPYLPQPRLYVALSSEISIVIIVAALSPAGHSGPGSKITMPSAWDFYPTAGRRGHLGGIEIPTIDRASILRPTVHAHGLETTRLRHFYSSFTIVLLHPPRSIVSPGSQAGA